MALIGGEVFRILLEWFSAMGEFLPRSASDTQLLRRFQRQRDEAAFGELIRRHGPLVWGVCRRRLDRLEDAEDAFQTTFLLLAIKSGTIRHPEALGSWLHRTASRTASRAVTGMPREMTDGPVAEVDVLLEMARREMVAALDVELDKLPGKYRDVLILFHFQGFSREQVAERLGISDAAVKARLTRARQLLRSRLVRRGVMLPLILPLAIDPLPAQAGEAAARLGATFARARPPIGDLFAATVSQGTTSLLSAITGKAGLASVALCAGLLLVWMIDSSVPAGDAAGSARPRNARQVEPTDLRLTLSETDEARVQESAESRLATAEPVMLALATDERADAKTEGDTDAGESAPAAPPQAMDEEILKKLSWRHDFQYDNIPLVDVLDHLSVQFDIPIHPSEQSILAAGLSIEDSVNHFEVKNVPLETGLETLLKSAGLGYVIENGILRVLPAKDSLTHVAEARISTIPSYVAESERSHFAKRMQALLSNDQDTIEVANAHHQAEYARPRDPVIELIGGKVVFSGTEADHRAFNDLIKRMNDIHDREEKARRDAAGSAKPLQMLDQEIQFQFTGSLEEGLRTFVRQTRIPISVDKAKLEQLGIPLTTQVDLKVDRISSRNLLTMMLKPSELGFAIDAGQLTIHPLENTIERVDVFRLGNPDEIGLSRYASPAEFSNEIAKLFAAIQQPLEVATADHQRKTVVPPTPAVAVIGSELRVVARVSDVDRFKELFQEIADDFGKSQENSEPAEANPANETAQPNR